MSDDLFTRALLAAGPEPVIKNHDAYGEWLDALLPVLMGKEMEWRSSAGMMTHDAAEISRAAEKLRLYRDWVREQESKHGRRNQETQRGTEKPVRN